MESDVNIKCMAGKRIELAAEPYTSYLKTGSSLTKIAPPRHRLNSRIKRIRNFPSSASPVMCNWCIEKRTFPYQTCLTNVSGALVYKTLIANNNHLWFRFPSCLSKWEAQLVHLWYFADGIIESFHHFPVSRFHCYDCSLTISSLRTPSHWGWQEDSGGFMP